MGLKADDRVTFPVLSLLAGWWDIGQGSFFRFGGIRLGIHGGKAAARALKEAGVECIFTLSGRHIMAIYR